MSLGSFLKNVSGFKLLEGKNILKDIGKNPSRLLTGVDPFSTKVWNKVLGTNNKPIVDQMGGATSERSDQARAAGIDPKNGEAVEKVAHVVAAAYAAGGLAGIGGGGAGAGVGEGATLGSGTGAGTTSITALSPEAVYSGGLTASNAAVAGITPASIGSAGGALGVAGGGAGVAATGLGSGTSITALSPEAVQAGGTTAANTAASGITPEAISSSGGGAANVAPSATSYRPQSMQGNSQQKKDKPYEDINENGGMNSVSEDLFSRYNKNEGNFNDGNKIVIQDGMAVLVDENGNEIGRRPNDANLHSMLQNVERG